MTETISHETSFDTTRLKRHATTHRQYVNHVMESLTIDKQHDHLSPIIENAVRMIVAAANNARQYEAANDCLRAIDNVLSDVYLTAGGEYTPKDYETGTNLGEQVTHGFKVDADGNTIKDSTLISYDDPELYKDNKRLLENRRLKLEEAVKAANSSAVFQTAGVELIITEGLLIYGGMIAN